MSSNNTGKGYVEHLSEIFEKTGVWSYDHRWVVMVLCVLILGVSLFFSSTIRFDNSFESFFDPEDPAYMDFLKYREDFGSDEISYIIYKAPEFEYGPWNIEIMRKIDHVTKTIEEEVPFVKRAISLANVEFIEGKAGQLLTYDLLSDFPETQEELLVLKEKVMKKPMYVGGLVSSKAEYGGIIVEMEKSSIDPLDEIMLDPEGGSSLDNLYPQVTHYKIEEILEREEYSGITFYHAGDIPLNAEYNIITEEESITLGVFSFVLITLLLIYFLKRPAGVIGPMTVVLVGIIITVGIIGMLGWDFDLMFTVLPTLLIVVGVADSVHIVTEFRIYNRRLGSRREAVKKTLYLVGTPCLFTSLTTVAGFISMSISPIKAIEHFAVYSAAGVFIAFLLTVTLLVVILSFGKVKRPAEKTGEESNGKNNRILYSILLKIADFDIRNKKSIIAVSAVVFVFAVAGLFRLEVDSNWLNEFAEDVEVRRTTEIVDSVMGGTGGFSYAFDTGEEDGMLDPGLLREMDALQKRAEKESSIVMKTYSLVDLLKDINMTFNNGDPAYYKIPDSRNLIAQYLLLYEMSGGDELKNYISSDYARANVEIRCKIVNTSIYKTLVNELDRYLKSRPGLKIVPAATGIGALWIELIDYIVESQIEGFLLAFVVIACMMCFLFKSFKTGLLSMIPNLTPVFITLGVMGWAGIPLDYIKLLIGCVAIGIAVDDTIHLVTRFHHKFKETGGYNTALVSSMKDVGRALFITTIVLVSGFVIMQISKMDSLADFGALVAVTLTTALVADFFLMPALVLVLKPFGAERNAASGER